MLAKLWKKVLLAICVIACIYNVMNKLVSRTSLEVQLNSIELSPLTNEEVYEYEKNYSSSKVDIDNEEDEESDESFVVVFDE